MAVGEPEISLNTWGLKYVRKEKEVPQQASGNTPANSTGINIQHEDTSSATDESKIDTTTSFGAGHATRHASTGDQGVAAGKKVSNTKAPSSKPSANITNPKTSKKVPAQDQTHNSGSGTGSGAFTAEGKPTTSGSKGHGSRTKPSGYESNTVRDESGKEVLSEAGNTKKLTVSDDSPKTSKYVGTSGGGVKNPNRDKKPEHGGTPSGVASTSLPKNAAALDLAINKCKLLKIKSGFNKSHSAGYLKDIEEGAEKFSKDGKTGGSVSTDASAKEYLDQKQATNTGAKIPDEKLGDLPIGQDEKKESTTTIEDASGNEKEVETGYKKWAREHKQASLDLAVEVINEAIKSIHRDTVDKDAAATTATQGMANFVYSDVKEDIAKKQAEKPFGEVLDKEGRPDEYSKEEHAEHDSNKDKQ